MKTLLVVLALLTFPVFFGVAQAASEIDTLKTIYRGQLSEYLQAEREFSVAREQYKQLQNLASIDKVILEAKEVMTSRNQVLQTYFLLLKANLQEANGIELAYKNKTLDRITETEEWLKLHQEKVFKASDRLELNDLADEFTEATPVFRLLSDQTTTLLSVGRLQNVFDQIEAAEDKVFPEASEATTAIDSDDFSREQRETARVMIEVEKELKNIWEGMRKGIDEFKSLSVSRNLVKQLDPAYTGLNKALGFIFEVVGL